jgi:hypothetical protein
MSSDLESLLGDRRNLEGIPLLSQEHLSSISSLRRLPPLPRGEPLGRKAHHHLLGNGNIRTPTYISRYVCVYVLCILSTVSLLTAYEVRNPPMGSRDRLPLDLSSMAPAAEPQLRSRKLTRGNYKLKTS